MQTYSILARPSRRLALLAGAALIAAAATPARAVEFSVDDWQVNLDTTLSSTEVLRTGQRSTAFIGKQNGGRFLVPNEDNGNLNFDRGELVAATQKITTELQVKRDDYGIFVRAYGFYDPVINSEKVGFNAYDYNGKEHFVGLSHAAQRDIGADLRLLDAYVFARPSVFGQPVDVRVGNQALNWGESTFIQFGINSITPLDTTQLRTTGSELRTAFLPIPAVDLKTDITDDISVEAFWQPYWTRTRLEPVGSFFNSQQDALLDGGTQGLLNPYAPDLPSSAYLVDISHLALFGQALPRRTDRHPTGLEEFGIALRSTLDIFDGTEVGLYFENYHSRIPFGHYFSGSHAAVPTVQFGGPIPPNGYNALTYASTAGFFADYPKNIHLLGASFNLTGPLGVAIQGEVSNRFNQPLQFSAADLLLASSEPLVCTPPYTLLAAACSQLKTAPLTQEIGNVGFNQDVESYKRYNVTQFQSTFTKLWGAMPDLGINQLALVGEIGGVYVSGFPKDSGVLNAPNTTDTSSAYSTFATPTNAGPLARKGFASPFSASYTVRALIDMPNVLPYGIGMKPTLAFQHDFLGTSPYGANIFQRNTAAASASVEFLYLNQWTLDLGYTTHFPLGDNGAFMGNLDRNFVSATISYLF